MRSQSLGRDAASLGLRLVAGGLLAGHGAQKLFGLFDGPGLQGTQGFMEKLGLKPGDRWALAAGSGELGSGLLTLLGFMSPAGPLGIFGPMMVATRTAHAGKPIWSTAGGAELPVVYMSIGAALTLIGPGRVSVDHLLGLRLSAPMVGLLAALVSGCTALALLSREEPTPTDGSARPESETDSDSESESRGQSGARTE